MSDEQPIKPMTFWGEFRGSLLLAAGLYFLDAIWLGAGGVAFLMLIGVVIFFIPAALLAWYRKNLLVRNLRAARGLLWVLTALASLATINIDLGHAREKGDLIVAALKAYHAKTGQYPEQLQQLVPEYLPAIPKARFALVMNDFRYMVSRDKVNHMLVYVAMPPFGFHYYNLEKGEWAVKD